MNIEKLLEAYPGLWLKRYAVSSTGKRYALDQLVTEIQRTKICPTGMLVPPTMDWYTSKQWQNSCDNAVSLTSVDDGRPLKTELEAVIDIMNAKIDKLATDQQAGFHDVRISVEDATHAIIRVQASSGNRMLFPALWTFECKTALNGIAAEYTLKFHSELTGKCHHEVDPIIINVGNSFLGKYGSYVKTGLTFFSSVIPDMFGKSAIEKIMEVSIEQLDRTVQVHSLVEGLELSVVGTRDMSQDRSLSPGESLALLRDLLRIKYGSDYDELKMSKYSGLECGIVMESMTTPYPIDSGKCIWASRDEIQQYGSKMLIAHDYAEDQADQAMRATEETVWYESSEVTVEQKRKLSEGRPTSRPDDSSSPTINAAERPTAMAMRIMRAEGLPNIRLFGTQSPYCKWQLVGSDQRVVASGQTTPDSNGGTNPQWEVHSSWIDLKSNRGATSFDRCTLCVVVKTAGLVPGTSMSIAKGLYHFQGVRNNDGKWEDARISLTSDGALAGTLHFKVQWSS